MVVVFLVGFLAGGVWFGGAFFWLGFFCLGWVLVWFGFFLNSNLDSISFTTEHLTVFGVRLVGLKLQFNQFKCPVFDTLYPVPISLLFFNLLQQMRGS